MAGTIRFPERDLERQVEAANRPLPRPPMPEPEPQPDLTYNPQNGTVEVNAVEVLEEEEERLEVGNRAVWWQLTITSVSILVGLALLGWACGTKNATVQLIGTAFGVIFTLLGAMGFGHYFAEVWKCDAGNHNTPVQLLSVQPVTI